MLTRRDFLLASLLASGGVLGCEAPRVVPLRPEVTPRKPKIPTRGKNIVVYLADTLRADHLGVYGHSVPTSPNIDRFAENAFLFEKCYAHAPWTKPSIASIFTGVVPRVHQAAISDWDMINLLQHRVQILRDSFKTLAESLKELGYRTAFLLTNPHVQRELGFGKGFDFYTYKGSKSPTGLVDDAIEWLQQTESTDPYFIFIHEIDPHGPYTASNALFRQLHEQTPKNALDALPNDDKKLLRTLSNHYAGRHGVKRPPLTDLSETGNSYLQKMYDAEILSVDIEFGRLLNALDVREERDSTIVVLTSDHGEEFAEHGAYFHGHSLYDELIHVPLIIAQGKQFNGARIPFTTGLIDLLPTLVTLAGGKPPQYIQGKTLLNEDGTRAISEDRAVMMDLDYYTPNTDEWEASMTLGSHKLTTVANGKKIRAFNRAADPMERHDLFDSPPQESGELDKLTRRFKDELSKSADLAKTFGPPVWSNSSEEFQAELEALGYLQ